MDLNETETSNTRVNFCFVSFYYWPSSEPDLLKSKLSSIAAPDEWLQTKLRWGASSVIGQLLTSLRPFVAPRTLHNIYIMSQLIIIDDTSPTDIITQHQIQCMRLNVCLLLQWMAFMAVKPDSESRRCLIMHISHLDTSYVYSSILIIFAADVVLYLFICWTSNNCLFNHPKFSLLYLCHICDCHKFPLRGHSSFF